MAISKDKFVKVKQVSAVDQVCDNIREKIASGELACGERLPSESDLGELYGVNRLTVRMALQKLSVLGMIETKVGEGSFVREFNIENVMKEIPYSLAFVAPDKDILQFRKMIEVESVKSAIANATKEDLAELDRRCTIAEELLPHGDAKFAYSIENLSLEVDRDFAFHQQLVVCSHNSLFVQIYSLLSPLIKASIMSNITLRTEAADSEPPQAFGDSVNIHRNLYNALVEKNWKKCKEILNRMIEYAVFLKTE